MALPLHLQRPEGGHRLVDILRLDDGKTVAYGVVEVWPLDEQ